MISLRKFRLVAVLLVFCLVFEVPGQALAKSYKGKYTDLTPLFKKPKQSDMWLSAGVMAASCILPAAFSSAGTVSSATSSFGMGAFTSSVSQMATHVAATRWGFNADAAQVFGYGVSGVLSGISTVCKDNTAYMSRQGGSNWWNNSNKYFRGAVVGGLKGSAVGGANLLVYNSLKDTGFYKKDPFFANQVSALAGSAIGHLGSSFVLGDVMHIKTTADVNMKDKDQWRGKTSAEWKASGAREVVYNNGETYLRIPDSAFSDGSLSSTRLAFVDPSFISSMVAQGVGLGIEYAAYKGALGGDLKHNMYYTRALGASIGGMAGARSVGGSIWTGLGNGILGGGLSAALNGMGGEYNPITGVNRWGMTKTQMAGVTLAGSYLARGLFAENGWKKGLIDSAYNQTSFGGTSPFSTAGAGGYTEAKYLENLAQYSGYANFKANTDYLRGLYGKGEKKISWNEFVKEGGLSNVYIQPDQALVRYVTSTMHYSAVDNLSAAVTGMPGTIASLFTSKEAKERAAMDAALKEGLAKGKVKSGDERITIDGSTSELMPVPAKEGQLPLAYNSNAQNEISNLITTSAAMGPLANPAEAVNSLNEEYVNDIQTDVEYVDGVQYKDGKEVPFYDKQARDKWIDQHSPSVGKKLWRIPQLLTLGMLPTLMNEENRAAMKLKDPESTGWLDTDYFGEGTFSGMIFGTKAPDVRYYSQLVTRPTAHQGQILPAPQQPAYLDVVKSWALPKANPPVQKEEEMCTLWEVKKIITSKDRIPANVKSGSSEIEYIYKDPALIGDVQQALEYWATNNGIEGKELLKKDDTYGTRTRKVWVAFQEDMVKKGKLTKDQMDGEVIKVGSPAYSLLEKLDFEPNKSAGAKVAKSWVPRERRGSAGVTGRGKSGISKQAPDIMKEMAKTTNMIEDMSKEPGLPFVAPNPKVGPLAQSTGMPAKPAMPQPDYALNTKYPIVRVMGPDGKTPQTLVRRDVDGIMEVASYNEETKKVGDFHRLWRDNVSKVSADGKGVVKETVWMIGSTPLSTDAVASLVGLGGKKEWAAAVKAGEVRIYSTLGDNGILGNPKTDERYHFTKFSTSVGKQTGAKVTVGPAGCATKSEASEKAAQEKFTSEWQQSVLKNYDKQLNK